MFKVLVLIACLSIVASTDYDDDYEHKEDFALPKYKFEHDVKDSQTGHHKTNNLPGDDGTVEFVIESSEEILPTDTSTTVTEQVPTTTMSTNVTEMERPENVTKKADVEKPSSKKTSCC